MPQRQRYTKEFKLEAVRQLDHGDMPAAVVARQLGVRRNQLYKWKNELSEKGEASAFCGPGRRSGGETSTNELTVLKRRVALLEEENLILKKAAKYFARELP
jgi:transposase